MVVPAAEASPFSSCSRFPGTFFRASPLPLRSRGTASPRAPRAAAPTLASLSSLRPPSRRANHLRPKLLRTLTPPPPPLPVPEAPQAPVGGSGGETGRALAEEGDHRDLQLPLLPPSDAVPADGHAFVLEEGESALVVRHRVGYPRPFHQRDVPRLLLQLSVYLVGLVAVQTVCAVWLFGGTNFGDGRSGDAATSAATGRAAPGKGEQAGPEVAEHEPEFGRMVSAIQAMAREARAAEAREASEKDDVSASRGDIMDEVNRRLGRRKKRMPRVHVDAKALRGDGGKSYRTPPKGFNGSKYYAAATRDPGKGESQLIGLDSDFREPPQLHALRKSKAHGYKGPEEETASSRDLLFSDFKNSQAFGNLNGSDQGNIKKSSSACSAGIDRSLNNPMPQDLVEDGSPFGEGFHCKQTDISSNSSGRVSETKNTGLPHSRSFLGKTSSTNRGSYTGTVPDKKTEDRHLDEKAEDSRSDAINKLWWLKLPHVLRVQPQRVQGPLFFEVGIKFGRRKSVIHYCFRRSC
uniref:Uncharacterized protein n=1 Tax=Anthurium amnicola TaxID=1678845 RepID=A0A1D1ZA02_9ARAE